jgi:predicted MFS family arabinose efflux permease
MFCTPAVRETLGTMLDFSLLRSITFLLLCLAGFLTMMGFFIPFVYLVEYAISVGIDSSQAAMLLSFIGGTNTVGRILSGWLSDRPNINALFITNLALTVGGIATVIMPFVTQYEILAICSATFGMSIACFASLRSIIVVELMGLEKLTNSYGLLLLFQGIASILGSPLAGLCFDKTGTYQASFCIAGILITFSGLMCLPLPWISRWERRRHCLLADSTVQEKLTNNDSSTV